jgi:RNA-directed DNA polymerase
MSLTTPEKIRSLQRKLYCKAKAEPAFRFYVLYDKVCREDILLHAYRLARANAGAPGVDGVTFATIEERGLEAWLTGLREDLVLKRYRPDPVRRVMIPKASGDGERPLGIPTIRDRVVQTAAKIVLDRSSRLISRTLRTAIAPDVGLSTRSRKCAGISSGATPMS